MSGQRSGFTLVEVLVVATIISMLAAMLLPLLQKARMMARQVQCASQMRQAGQFLDTYCDRYNNYYPDVVSGVAGSWTTAKGYPFGANCWQEALGGLYLGYPADSSAWGAGRYGIFHCPSGPREVHVAAGATKGVDYKMNQKFHDPAYFFKRNRIQRPVACFGDAFDPWAAGDDIADPSWALSPRHNGRVNMYFSDSHISTDWTLLLPTNTNKIPYNDR